MVDRGELGKDLVSHCCFLGFLSIVRQLTGAFTMASYQFITLFYSFLIVVLLVYPMAVVSTLLMAYFLSKVHARCYGFLSPANPFPPL